MFKVMVRWPLGITAPFEVEGNSEDVDAEDFSLALMGMAGKERRSRLGPVAGIFINGFNVEALAALILIVLAEEDNDG